MDSGQVVEVVIIDGQRRVLSKSADDRLPSARDNQKSRLRNEDGHQERESKKRVTKDDGHRNQDCNSQRDSQRSDRQRLPDRGSQKRRRGSNDNFENGVRHRSSNRSSQRLNTQHGSGHRNQDRDSPKCDSQDDDSDDVEDIFEDVRDEDENRSQAIESEEHDLESGLFPAFENCGTAAEFNEPTEKHLTLAESVDAVMDATLPRAGL